MLLDTLELVTSKIRHFSTPSIHDSISLRNACNPPQVYFCFLGAKLHWIHSVKNNGWILDWGSSSFFFKVSA